MTNESEPLAAGVIGVGSMGRHHARVYEELPNVTLDGIHDADQTQARTVADDHGTEVRSREELLDQVDVVSVAVPTAYHDDVASECIQQGVHTLIEKPFVEDPERGEALLSMADREDVVLQIGHIERFNPAIVTLRDILPELEIVAVDAKRLGPPLERHIDDNVVTDLMIHDIDILLWLVDAPVRSIEAAAPSPSHATATLEFENDIVGTLTASRATQRKVRTLSITAKSCYIEIDYMDQSVEIYRHSLPEYIEDDGDVRYRHESIIERPMVESGEPLRNELESFVSAVRRGRDVKVSATDGVRAVECVQRIEQAAGMRWDWHSVH
ncbi:Gfo/Idh/MocA family oxidoreductase [Halomicrobium sp. IBSBa]|uniref:Gfo/Idh/MocA family protein n=1 Tax=Halomicrobium sp. IBSBa TaxID=2778916 RepID=UPI001ABF6D4D|nr:Gfo/Idh/MocA family oxidoreductase [Halomicrobium sp. IBSBa]MBO4248896.1 Gfo/Idh/MocA family oxidoreductase [Halomicrobium sp. IBSBa]